MLAVAGLGLLVVIAALDLVVPRSALFALVAVSLVGAVAVAGAGRARYCAKCNVRLAPPPSDPSKR